MSQAAANYLSRRIIGFSLFLLFLLIVGRASAQRIEDPDQPGQKTEKAQPETGSRQIEDDLPRAPAAAAPSARDWAFAREFSPVFCQDFGPLLPGISAPAPPAAKSKSGFPLAHADYITRVDFDGNWIADDNWQNFESPAADFRAAVYFYGVETESHYFLFFCVFHPRDWGSIHENDLEGALVVVEKDTAGSAALGRPVYMETLSHNVFLKYHHSSLGTHVPGSLGKMLAEGNHPMAYIEPRGHGMHGLTESQSQRMSQGDSFVVYRNRKSGEHPADSGLKNVGYELIPLSTSLWVRAQSAAPGARLYCQNRSLGPYRLSTRIGERVQTVEKHFPGIGVSLCGDNGRPNAAHPPWAWSLDGKWFFQPAETIRKDFLLKEVSFSTVYIHHPLLGVVRNPASP